MNFTQVWSSGGGMQSAAIAALIVAGKLRPDIGVIVDTGREQSTTWQYMDAVITPALSSVDFMLHRVLKTEYATVDLYGGKNRDSLLLPIFTNQSGTIGKLPTYCSNEWKTRVVRRWLRERGISRADVWLGISLDEKHRAKRNAGPWRSKHPLIELGMSRADCIALIKRMGWPPAPRSSCWMCPNHTQEEWRDIRDNKPADWKLAVQFDNEIRQRDPNAFLHHDCVSLDHADLEELNGVLFRHCDTGNCFV